MMNRRILFFPVLAILSACGGKLAAQKTLVPLNAKTVPLTQALDAPVLTYTQKVCSSEPVKVNHTSYYTLVLDMSGSNYDGSEGPGSLGTDHSGLRRFGALKQYLNQIKDTYKNLPEEFSKLRFNLILFNDSRNFALSDKLKGGLGYMDRGFENELSKNGGDPATIGSTYYDANEFEKIVSAVQQNIENAIPGSTGWRNISKAATDYRLGLTAMNDSIERELKRLEIEYNATPDAYKKVFFVDAFISDGKPQGQSIQLGNGTWSRENVRYIEEISPQLDRTSYLVNNTYRTYTLGFQTHTVIYSNQSSEIDSINQSMCQNGSATIPAVDLHNCPKQLLKTMARKGGGSYYEVWGDPTDQKNRIPYEKFAIPSYSVQNNAVNFFFSNRGTLWNSTGALVNSPMNDGLTLGDNQLLCAGSQNSFIIQPVINQDGQCAMTFSNEIRSLSSYLLGNAEPLTNRIAECSSHGIGSMDSDGDGLTDCEEFHLGSNSMDPDSNADGIPDELAARFRLPFRTGEASASQIDSDRDGVLNVDELVKNTPVFLPNDKIQNLVPQSMSVRSLGIEDGKSCYEVSVGPVLYAKTSDQLELVVIETRNITESSRPSPARILRKCAGDFLGKYNAGEGCGL